MADPAKEHEYRQEAERLALADVLRQADPPAGEMNAAAEASAGPTPARGNTVEPAPAVQTGLFAAEKGPYA